MECILLGSGGMMPMPYRLLTSLAVRLNGRIYLFDAGEGAQLGLKETRIGVRGITMIAVSHLHADHCLGIPGIMMLRAQMEDPEPLTIVGPPGTERFVRQTHENLAFYLNYQIIFREWAEDGDGPAYEDDQVRVYRGTLEHTRLCFGYRLEERERPGRFYPQRAVALGVPKGPLWGRLQQGQSVVLDDGRTITADQVLGESRRGRRVAYVVDTRPCRAIYRLIDGADIAFVEGMFLPEDGEHAESKDHLTVVDAARIAGRAGVRRVVLVHVSPRYDVEALARLDAAARARFDRAEMGRDFQIYQVPLPETD
jgi:ribonuclease Z